MLIMDVEDKQQFVLVVQLTVTLGVCMQVYSCRVDPQNIQFTNTKSIAYVVVVCQHFGSNARCNIWQVCVL